MYFMAVNKSIKCSGCVIYLYLKTICRNYLSKMVCKRVRGWERFWFIMFRKILSRQFLSHFMSQKICLLDWLVLFYLGPLIIYRLGWGRGEAEDLGLNKVKFS